MSSDHFHTLPLPAVYCFSVLVVLLSLWAGVLLGRRYLRAGEEGRETSLGSVVAATLGLLAFLLAFTFNMTAERFNQRKMLLLDEVNVIGTTYLRADFLSGEDAGRAKKLLAEYANVRDFLSGATSPGGHQPGAAEDVAWRVARSAEIQRALWQLVQKQIALGRDPNALRLFAEPLNQVIDLHNSRFTVGGEYRIPSPIWGALYIMTVLSMLAIGFQCGTSSTGSLQLALALALTFATVILLIADLDRTAEGALRVDQNPMSRLNAELRQAEKARLVRAPLAR